ncbi:MAG TPA: hypothetical protein VLJ11_19235 [Bryobacteraceae bacterium]|nr:hypothetical protein [Bryobacteraceae bacterium]
MGNYISSNANRFYVALEASYGKAAPVNSINRFPAVRLQAQQVLEAGKRQDKSGTRTFQGTSKDSRRHTAFQVRSYLASWNGTGEPSYGPLFQAGLGAQAEINRGLVIAAAENQAHFQTTVWHGLSVGSAVSFGNELRFVTAVPDSKTIVVNAPFSTPLAQNVALAPAVTYKLSTALPSVTLYDYWDPVTTVSRIVCGAAVDTCVVSVNGDFHEFAFGGPAADLIDSTAFTAGTSGVDSFPTEPPLDNFEYSVVPGHLGQVWLGSTANQFFTLTDAAIEIKNSVELRSTEFGSSYPTAVTAGERHVTSHFTLLAQDDAQTNALYAAARLRNPIAAMLQLGQQQGQLMGIMLPSVMPEVPGYNDSQTRLHWEFKNNRAQGNSDDELYIAFA